MRRRAVIQPHPDEQLTIDVNAGPDICAICRKPPPAQRLDLGLSAGRKKVNVTICRDCLSEYAPKTLTAIEEER